MISIKSDTRNTFRPLYEQVQNGKSFLWFYDGYFFKSLAKASDYIEGKWLFTDPLSSDIVKAPRGIDRTVWYPISHTDGTWYKRQRGYKSMYFSYASGCSSVERSSGT
jgi:hypothetical protein